MTSNQLFAAKCERIKNLTSEAHETARLFNSFRYHQPTLAYLDAIQAARNARALADELDKLAEKIAPQMMQAAE